MSLHTLANHMAAQGRNNDSMLVHMTPKEVSGLHALAAANGGQLTINPETGLPEAGLLEDLFPAIIGFGLNTFVPGLGEVVGGAFGLGAAAGTGIAVGGLTALATGNLSKGVMAGFGAYGGAGLGESLVGAGVNAATNAGTAGYESILAERGLIPGTEAYGAAASELALGAQNSAKAASLASSPMDRLTAGFSATTQSPEALMNYAGSNYKYGIAAAAPALAGLSEEDDTVTKMPSTGMITPFVMNRKQLARDESLSPSAQQKYLSYGVTPITPFKAAEGGEVQEFRMGGFNRNSLGEERYFDGSDGGFGGDGSEGPPLSLAPPEGEMDMQVVVYGPDGQMYGSPGAARRAGVTNYTTDMPVNFGGEGGNSNDNMRSGGDEGNGGGTTDPYTQQFIDKAKTYKNTMTGDSASAFDYLMGNRRPTAQTTGRTGVSSSRGTVRAPVGMQKPAVPASTEDIQALADVARGGGGGGYGGGGGGGIGAGYGSQGQHAGEGGGVAGSPMGGNAAPPGGPPSGPSGGEGGGGGGGEGGGGGGGGGIGAGHGSGGQHAARGGLLDQYYADGGVTGGGNIDLHVPISIGGGGGGMGGETFGGGNGIQQGGTPQQPYMGGLGGLLGQLQPQMPQEFAQQATDQMEQTQPLQQQFMQPFGGVNAQRQQAQQAQQAMQAAQLSGKQNQAFGGNMGGMRYGAFANGGMTGMADGGLGSLGGYSDGGRLLRGPGDGVSDSIPATIGQRQPARLADGEFVVPARIVSELGNGSTEAGARQLYAMMDRIQKGRKKTVGKNKVAANTRSAKHLPA